MKIAILGTRGIPARYGGFETFAAQLGMRLVERGHEVTVFCEPAAISLAEYRGMRLEHVPVPSLGPLRTILFDARCLWRARKRFDLVYMLGYGASAFCIIPRFWGTPVWINMDGIEWSRAKWGRVAKLYLKMAEKIAGYVAHGLVADAHAIARYLISAYPHVKRCSVIAYGAPIISQNPDPSAIHSLGLEPEGYYLVVCRLEPENHVKEIVEGFTRAATTRSLVVVGDHQVENDYVRQVRAFAGTRVRFVGPVYEPEMLQALRFYSFAYLHGHSVGGTNPSLLEAMGCANAVIAHDNCFNREVLDRSGIFFSTPGQLAERIALLEADHEVWLRLKVDAVHRIQERYTWDAITEQYCQLFADGEVSVPADSPVRLATEPVSANRRPSC